MAVNPVLPGVSADQLATLRQARGSRNPDPVYAAQRVEYAGADSIRMRLREDRRQIQDRDLRLARQTINNRLNLELAVSGEMLEAATGYAHGQGLQVNAGHGPTRHDLRPIAAKVLVTELDPGHAIVADAVFVGLAQAAGDFRRALREARVQGS